MEYPKILIFSPEPYRKDSTSRCLFSFFGAWDRKCVAQFYTTNNIPGYGFCDNYFRITDSEMVKSLLSNRKPGCVIFPEEDTVDFSDDTIMTTAKKVKNFLTKESILFLVFRSVLWRKNKWNNKAFRAWVKAFNPDIVFLDLGSDFRLNNMALSVAKEYNIKIITFIPDDFFFKLSVKKSIFSRIYKRVFEKKLFEIFRNTSKAIFSCELMKEKYTGYFNCAGEVMYFSSDIERNDKFDLREDKFFYAGGFGHGRWKALIEFANILNSVNPNFKLEVYGKTDNKKILSKIKACIGIEYKGFVPYEDVEQKLMLYKYVVHIENFDKKNIEGVRYSLSTKIADCVKSGICIIAYAPEDVGVVDYLKKTNTAFVYSNKEALKCGIKSILKNREVALEKINHTKEIAELNHNTFENQRKFYNLCKES